MAYNFHSLKTTALAALMLILMAGGFTSCGGDDDDSSPAEDFSPEALHGGGSKTWQYVQRVEIDVVLETNDSTSYEYFAEACNTDDDYVFKDDNTLEFNAGDVDCDTSGAGVLFDATGGNYTYNESAKTLSWDLNFSDGSSGSDDFTVVELTDSRLVLEGEFFNDPADPKYKYWSRTTFTKK